MELKCFEEQKPVSSQQSEASNETRDRANSFSSSSGDRSEPSSNHQPNFLDLNTEFFALLDQKASVTRLLYDSRLLESAQIDSRLHLAAFLEKLKWFQDEIQKLTLKFSIVRHCKGAQYPNNFLEKAVVFISEVNMLKKILTDRVLRVGQAPEAIRPNV